MSGLICYYNSDIEVWTFSEQKTLHNGVKVKTRKCVRDYETCLLSETKAIITSATNHKFDLC